MRTVVCLAFCLAGTSLVRAEELSGVILTDDGKPAAGATVHAAAIFHKPPLRMTTVADETGTFTLDLPLLSGDERYALAVRWHRQGADLTEGLNADGESKSFRGQKLPRQVVRLRPAGRLRGKLLRAEDDGPVAGAKLFLDTGEVLLTDEKGNFEVEGLAMKNHSLIASAPRRVRNYVLFDTSLKPEAQLEIRLAQGAVIKGRITDEAGSPIPGAFLTRWTSGSALTLNGWDEACHGDGTFEYSGLSSERLFFSLQVRAPGYRAEWIASDVDNPNAVIERDVRLKKSAPNPEAAVKAAATLATGVNNADTGENAAGKVADERRTTELARRTIRGVITDAEGAPVAKAKVRWGAFQWDTSAKSTKTDAEGKYELAGVPSADGAVFVVAEAYAPQFAPVKADENDLDVGLEKGTTVRGVVKNSAGKPVRRVQVIMLTQCMTTGYCNSIWIDERSTHTDEKGEFEIAAVPQVGVQFDILKNGYSEMRNQTLTPGGELNEILLAAGGAVRGRVVDAAGDPVRNFNVRVMIPRERKPNERLGGYYAGFDWYGVAFTRDDGVFVLSDVGKGAWLRLVVTSPGAGRAVLDRVQVGTLDAPPADDLTIRLEPYRSLSVRVIERDSGEPLAGARVSLLEDELFPGGFNWGYHDLWAIRRRTDSQGTATFAEPKCEDGTLIVRAPAMARRCVPWTEGAVQVTVELEPAARLQGEVRVGGKRLAEGWARLMSADNHNESDELARGEGRFEFDELPAGSYTLSITGVVGQQLDSRHITLEAGKAHSENIELSADAGKKPPK